MKCQIASCKSKATKVSSVMMDDYGPMRVEVCDKHWTELEKEKNSRERP